KQGGAWQEYVHAHLLPRLFGFELLVAPYVIAHLKLGLLLRELGYEWSKEDRLRIYLTNALDEGVTAAETLGNLGWYISQEANDAAQVKKSAPIMVVTGNPPYSGHSVNPGEWIAKLVRDYYFVDGQPLGERNPKWLQDDYVKFIRFAQWRIQKTGHGILAFITNHSYLDNPTFRGMRHHLLKTFDEIYVLDLHGNAKKKERAPRGGKDENIFDIQQGVAILLAVKMPEKKASNALAQMHHAHLYGERKNKFAFLENNHVGSIKWTTLPTLAPAYFFVPHELKRRKEYERGWKITEAMPVNSLGVTTARDEFAVAFERRTLQKRIAEFVDKNKTDAQLLQEYGLHNTESWNILKSRTRLRRSRQPEAFSRYNYRPFDTRWTYYDSAILERDRSEVLGHVHNQKNIALVTLRRSRTQEPWNFAFIGEYPVDKSFITSLDNAFVFPLYLYPNGDFPPSLFDYDNGRRPNLSDRFIEDCSQKLNLQFIPDGKGDLKKTFGPEDVFNYAYAVFHSPTYRERYAEFLKIDFPRLPLTSDKKLFAKLAAKGAELVSLHLLKSRTVDDLISTYPIAGDNVIERVHYEKKKAWINGAQYFGNVPENVWAFKVGGYQVCEKWLKDRKGRVLNNDDLTHYQRVIAALKETMRVMAEIDKTIPSFPLP
ncbi:MAG: type ISP restriction/modification enzyme, partial [candidate division KSB1 bacterium]